MRLRSSHRAAWHRHHYEVRVEVRGKVGVELERLEGTSPPNQQFTLLRAHRFRKPEREIRARWRLGVAAHWTGQSSI